MIERLYTLPAAAQTLGMSPRACWELLRRAQLPRRLERNPPHGFRRVLTSSDLETLSAFRVAHVTALGQSVPLRFKSNRVA